jgi:hypothetical protein
MQEAPAPTILPLDSTPDGIIDGNSAVPLRQQGPEWQEAIMLMSPAK